MEERQITVWCLLGKKAGDNTQVLALADELGWGYSEKSIVARPWELLVHLKSAGTLAGIDRAASNPLEAPWPDLVITAGRRNEPVARWIQQQAGGTTRLVHIGRPWAPLSVWDLVVTTPQYELPQQANIVHNSLPLHRLSAAELDRAGAQLLPQLAVLPRPWIAVLVGGDSGRFVFTEGKGLRLGGMVNDLATAVGGSLLVTDSPRTPVAAGDAMQSQLTAPHFCYRFGRGGDNPYRGLLALADAFVVTGESMSMLGEAADSGRPLFIFDVGDGTSPQWRQLHNYRYKPLSHHLAMWLGPRRMRRDIGRIQDALVDAGRALWLDEGTVFPAAESLQTGSARERVDLPAANAPTVAKEELQRAAQAVRQLVISQ